MQHSWHSHCRWPTSSPQLVSLVIAFLILHSHSYRQMKNNLSMLVYIKAFSPLHLLPYIKLIKRKQLCSEIEALTPPALPSVLSWWQCHHINLMDEHSCWELTELSCFLSAVYNQFRGWSTTIEEDFVPWQLPQTRFVNQVQLTEKDMKNKETCANVWFVHVGMQQPHSSQFFCFPLF